MSLASNALLELSTNYQCVLIRREFIEEIKSFGSKYGWVQDIMSGIICEDKNWKIGVCDWLPLIHYAGGTRNDNSNKPIVSQYNQLAEKEMVEYFRNNGKFDDLIRLRELASQYTYTL